MGAIIRAIDVPLDDETAPALAELAAAFNQIRDSAISDEERLIQGGLICDEVYFGCGGAPNGRTNTRALPPTPIRGWLRVGSGGRKLPQESLGAYSASVK